MGGPAIARSSPDLDKWLDYLENRSADILKSIELFIAFLAAIPAAAVTAGGAILQDPVLGPYAFVVLATAVLTLTYSVARAIIDRSAVLFLARLILGGLLTELPLVFAAYDILLGYQRAERRAR